MGFYAPAQIVRDAREHGVEVRPVCVNASDWDCTLEATDGPLRRAARPAHGEGVGQRRMAPRLLVAPRRRALSPRSRICGAAPASGRRRWSSWRTPMRSAPRPRPPRGAVGDPGAATTSRCRLFAAAEQRRSNAAGIHRADRSRSPPMSRDARSWRTTAASGSTLRRHPVAFLRAELDAHAASCRARDLASDRDGRRVTVPGIVLVRQKPGSAKGVMFITHRGRDRRRQPDHLAVGVRDAAPPDPVGRHDRLPRPRAAGRRRDPRRDRASDRPHRPSAQRRRARRGVPAAAWARRRGDAWRRAGCAREGRRGRSKPRDIFIPDLRLGSGIKVPTRDFR